MPSLVPTGDSFVITKTHHRRRFNLLSKLNRVIGLISILHFHGFLIRTLDENVTLLSVPPPHKHSPLPFDIESNCLNTGFAFDFSASDSSSLRHFTENWRNKQRQPLFLMNAAEFPKVWLQVIASQSIENF
jgi:hypothetical protein